MFVHYVVKILLKLKSSTLSASGLHVFLKDELSRHLIYGSCACFSVDEPIDTLATVTVQIDDEESTVRFVDGHHVQVADPIDE